MTSNNLETTVTENITPTAINGTKKRKTNKELRAREFMTPDEVDRLQKAAGLIARSEASRVRNVLMVRMGFLHGLRVSELCDMEWGHIDTLNRRVLIVRAKNGNNATHPLLEDELRLLSRLLKLTKERQLGIKYLFLSEEGFKISERGVRKIILKAGEKAGFEFPVHPHMLRHSCGHYLAEKMIDTRTIQDYMGHKNIAATMLYTQGTSKRFDNLFK